MLRFLLLAVLLACVSAFVPPATLAQRSVVGRAASVEMGASKGMMGLCPGSKATLVIAPDLGYGDEGSGDDIPGGATLHFDIEVVHVSETPPLPNVFMQMDTDSSGSLTLEEVLWFAQGTGASQNQAAQTFRSQDIDGDGVISWHEFDGPKTGPMGVDVKSLKDEP